MLRKSKNVLLVLGVALLSIGLMAFAPYNGQAAPTLDGQGGPNGQGGYGQGGGAAGAGYGHGAGVAGSGNGQYCDGTCTGTTTTLTPLSEAEEEALKKAILEEYGALNLYQAVIDKFGSTFPFSRIVRSEQQHVNALLRQADKYDIEAPANPGLSTPITFTTLADACQAGVDAEKADAALYDELKPVTTHSDLVSVYNRLQSTSFNSHLPAFEACN